MDKHAGIKSVRSNDRRTETTLPRHNPTWQKARDAEENAQSTSPEAWPGTSKIKRKALKSAYRVARKITQHAVDHVDTKGARTQHFPRHITTRRQHVQLHPHHTPRERQLPWAAILVKYDSWRSTGWKATFRKTFFTTQLK